MYLSNMYILPIYKLSLGLYMHYPPHSSPIQSIAKINYTFCPSLNKSNIDLTIY